MPEWLLPYAGRPRASKVRVKEEWIVVAPKADTEVVDYLLKRSPVVIGRVIWTDEGPIKFYSSMGDVWRDLIETAGVAPHCPLVV